MEATLPADNKRSREDFDESPDSPESPEAKRIRADLLLDILDEDLESDGRGPAIPDLDSVMRSFEEEIALPLPPPADLAPDLDPRQPDLGFLLEASDDELGLPPTVLSSSDEAAPPPKAEEAAVDVEGEGVGFGKIWGFGDEIHLDFGFGSEERREYGEDDGGVFFDGGLFDYSDGVRGPSDFSDLTWRPEFLPAV